MKADKPLEASRNNLMNSEGAKKRVLVLKSKKMGVFLSRCNFSLECGGTFSPK